MQILRSRLVSLLAIIVVLLGGWTCLSRAQGEAPTTGELKLEGKHIQKLVLHSKDGKTETFHNPGESIKLPAGDYRLREVRLEGGYVSRLRLGPDNRVTVGKDEAAVLKVGAPLKQTVKVSRQGSVLALGHRLLGVGGHSYVLTDRAKPAQFTIYKGDRKIASGKFEFG